MSGSHHDEGFHHGNGLTRPGGWAPAPLSRRFGALVVDWIACLLVSGTFARPMVQGWAPVLVLIGEYGFFLGLFGQTPGMWVTRIRCLDHRDGRPVGVPRALLRGVLLAAVVPGLIMDQDRRGLHDRAAGSVVVAGPSSWPPSSWSPESWPQPPRPDVSEGRPGPP